MCWNTQNWSYSASFLFSLGFKASGKQLSPCWIIDYREQSWMQPATLLLYQSACPAQSLSLSAATTSNARFHQCSHFHPGQIFMHMLFYISYICCLHSWLVANYSISVMQNSYAWKVRLGNEFCTLCFWMIIWLMRHLHEKSGFHATNHGSPHSLASQWSLFTKQPEENDQQSVWQEKTLCTSYKLHSISYSFMWHLMDIWSIEIQYENLSTRDTLRHQVWYMNILCYS